MTISHKDNGNTLESGMITALDRQQNILPSGSESEYVEVASEKERVVVLCGL